MAQKLADQAHESSHRLRKEMVEPVFCRFRQARDFRQFLLRGLDKVKTEGP
jgi:hypothetical protein